MGIRGLDSGLMVWVIRTGLLRHSCCYCATGSCCCSHLHAIVELSEELLHGRRLLLLLTKPCIALTIVPLDQITKAGSRSATSLHSLIHALGREEIFLSGGV